MIGESNIFILGNAQNLHRVIKASWVDNSIHSKNKVLYISWRAKVHAITYCSRLYNTKLLPTVVTVLLLLSGSRSHLLIKWQGPFEAKWWEVWEVNYEVMHMESGNLRWIFHPKMEWDSVFCCDMFCTPYLVTLASQNTTTWLCTGHWIGWLNIREKLVLCGLLQGEYTFKMWCISSDAHWWAYKSLGLVCFDSSLDLTKGGFLASIVQEKNTAFFNLFGLHQFILFFGGYLSMAYKPVFVAPLYTCSGLILETETLLVPQIILFLLFGLFDGNQNISTLQAVHFCKKLFGQPVDGYYYQSNKSQSPQKSMYRLYKKISSCHPTPLLLEFSCYLFEWQICILSGRNEIRSQSRQECT